MVTVKIECGCGQHYAFDVEPVNGQMASAVACPICGTDGTAVANAILVSKVPPPFRPPPTRVNVPPRRAATPPPAPVTAPPSAPSGSLFPTAQVGPEPAPAPPGVKVSARVLGLVDHATAEIEARAKISWGDSRDDVISYLMLQGFSAPEAKELVAVLFKERLAALRVKGIRKILIGFGAMCVPVIAWGTMAHLGIIFMKALALAVMVGLWGCWEVLNGIIMLVAPKMESGEIGE